MFFPQGYPIREFIREWKLEVNPGIKISHDTSINVLLFADDLTILQRTEDDLQKAVYKLEQVAKEYNLEISVPKTKVMALKGKYSIRSIK